MQLGTAPFGKERWLPADWPELEHKALIHALTQISASWNDPALGNDPDERMDILRATTCLYWLTSEDPSLFSTDELESYTGRWAFNRPADRPWTREDWLRAFVYIHASAALLVKLHFDEDGFSERARELIDDLASLAEEMEKGDTLHEPGTYYRDMPNYFNGTAAMRQSLVSLCSLAWCFKFHMAQADDDAVDAFEAAFQAFWVTEKGSSGQLLFFAEPTSLIEDGDSALGIFAWWVNATDVARAFEDAYESRSPKISWGQWAMACEMLKFGYTQGSDWLEEHQLGHFERVNTRIGGFREPSGQTWLPSYPPAEFFTFARGLCVRRLSPDEYRALRDEDERRSASDRLQRYLLLGRWNDLPDEARNELIAADQLYWAPQGSKSGLAGHLRRAAEIILKERIVAPFRDWRKKQGHPVLLNTNSGELPHLLRELQHNDNLFHEFAAATYTDLSKRKWRALMKDLHSLVKLRNRSEHPEDHGPVDPGKVASEYRKFIGIGSDGVIQRLLWYKPEPYSE